jgi:hypothetical protein
MMLATRQIRIPFYVLSALFLSIAATTVLAQEETRTSTTVHYTKAQRDAGVAGKLSKDEYSSLQPKSGLRRSSSPANGDFWFYIADVLLFNDHDDDGHFHGIDLLFDADTYYQAAEVYAVVYLSLEGGPWSEYSATDNFTLFGSSADDEFQIVTELVSGYPTGSYDLLIELFDGYNDDFLASYGPIDTSELAFLPLEDANRDAPYIPPPTTVIVHEDGGSLGGLSLLALLALLFVRRARQYYWAN